MHITIPTDNPWVPLRILGLGKQANDFILADVFLLTDSGPEFLPGGRKRPLPRLLRAGDGPSPGRPAVRCRHGLDPGVRLADEAQVLSSAADLRYDLAVDASGEGMPSLMRTGVFALRDANSSPSSLPDTGDRPGTAVSDWLQLAAVGASALAFLAFFVWYSASSRRDT